eukprot:517448-Heterocapsa_arctica.AAC.1
MVAAGSGCGHGKGSAAAGPLVDVTLFSFASKWPPSLRDYPFDIANVVIIDCAHAFRHEDPDGTNKHLKRALGYATMCDGHNGL